ncbi:hypothetical protein TNIN_435491 [Trichonephila inaurata madagascariensis]|uniref:Uncharacterized protein n=1 Tax=Trichonephila inaurata madagascariensis TaxID=2747483 RepID=A0A8X6YXJ6_9ARAC|nr:hypothetical protein TNIN_435491 [Trichonephila inaurata madagascariensis]
MPRNLCPSGFVAEARQRFPSASFIPKIIGSETTIKNHWDHLDRPVRNMDTPLCILLLLSDKKLSVWLQIPKAMTLTHDIQLLSVLQIIVIADIIKQS